MSVMQQLLTQHIDIWTAAETEKKSGRGRASGSAARVYGISKLRELIYELAANGRIVDHKADVHESLLGDVVEFVMGQAPPGNECNKNGDGVIFVKTGEFGSIYPEVKEWTTKPLKFARQGDVLICVVGATIGKLNLAIDCAIGRSVAAIRPIQDINTAYLYLVLMPFTLKLRAKSRGSAQGVIGKTELSGVKIRIPPIAEQEQIVAKVDQLMALCDQLEAQHSDAANVHEHLVSHLLGTLTQSQNASDFNANWQRIAAHFDTLFTTEASIDALKQTLLQLAVMGKLVAQDADDEPASQLFKRIQAEKAQLITQGKIKKDKVFAKISRNNMAFELPPTWEWAHIGELAQSTEYGLSEQTFDTLNGIPVLKMGDIQNGKVILGGQKKVDANTEGLPDLYLKTGDLLYNRTNSAELVGKTGIFQGADAKYTFASYLIRIRCFSDLFSPSYLNLAMNTPLFRKTQIDPHLKQQCGQANVNGTIMKNMIVPFPALAEQRRICAKVDEMMALCDQLKSHITNVNQHQKNLADVLVEHAVDG